MKRKIDLLHIMNELKFHGLSLYYKLGLNEPPKIYIPLSMILVPVVAMVIYQLIKY